MDSEIMFDYRLKTHRSRVLLLCFVGLVFVLILYYYIYLLSGVKDGRLAVKNMQEYSVWPRFEISDRINCFNEKKLVPSLSNLENNLKAWSEAKDDACQNLYQKFLNIYSIGFRTGELRVPNEFLPQVSDWLNHNRELLEDLNHQLAIHIVNLYTREYSSFSPLRSKRPQKKSGKNDPDPKQYVEQVVKESAQNCDFCNYKTHTSEDVFGRIVTNYSASAANTFKLDRWHSLIIPFRHHPLQLTEIETLDTFNAAKLWFNKVHSLEPEYKYPWITLDVMPHAGASQVHPHLHVGMSPNFYVGMFENARFAAQRYFQDTGNNFFTDLTSIHFALGLGITFGKAVAIAQLTSKKDTEITIISAEPGDDYFKLIFYATKTFYKMGFLDFSSLAAFPIMDENAGSLPAIIRIASRGDVSNVRSEISSFELFQFGNLNIDLYQVIKNLQELIDSGLQ